MNFKNKGKEKIEEMELKETYLPLYLFLSRGKSRLACMNND